MAKKQFNFSKSFQELESLVEELESGEISLDEALRKYEDGLKVVKECKAYLSDVENKVKVIREKYEDNE